MQDDDPYRFYRGRGDASSTSHSLTSAWVDSQLHTAHSHSHSDPPPDSPPNALDGVDPDDFYRAQAHLYSSPPPADIHVVDPLHPQSDNHYDYDAMAVTALARQRHQPAARPVPVPVVSRSIPRRPLRSSVAVSPAPSPATPGAAHGAKHNHHNLHGDGDGDGDGDGHGSVAASGATTPATDAPPAAATAGLSINKTPKASSTARPSTKAIINSINQLSNQSPPSASTSTTTLQRGRFNRIPSLQTTSTASPPSASSTPQSAAKDNTYGQYRFHNLKPRDRRVSGGTSSTAVDKTKPAPTGAAVPTTPSKTATISAATSFSSTASPAASQTPPVRRLFFGEVVCEGTEGQIPGYGIPSVSQPRRDSDSSVQQSNPMAHQIRQHARNHSESTMSPVETNPLAPSALPQPMATAPGGRHGRWASNNTSPTHETPLSAAMLHQTVLNLERLRRQSPPSRIPVPRRRRSTTSNSSTSTRSSKTDHPHRSYPLTTTGRLASPANDPSSTTPPRPSARRYGRSSPSKTTGPSQSLQAVIRAPALPTSPRLRHSKARESLSSSSNSLDQQKHSTENTRTRKEMPAYGMSRLAIRRAQLDKQAREERARSLTPIDKAERRPKAHAVDGSYLQATQQPLTVKTQNLALGNADDSSTPATEFEAEDESLANIAAEPTPSSFSTLSAAPPYDSSIRGSQTASSEAQMGASRAQSANIPNHADGQPLPLRPLDGHRSSLNGDAFSQDPRYISIAHTDYTDDSLAHGPDAESIRIVLGVTPVLDSAASPWHRNSYTSQAIMVNPTTWPEEAGSPLGEGISFLDDATPIDNSDNRAQMRHRAPIIPRKPLSADPLATPNLQSEASTECPTLDSEAYNVIHRLLHMYRGSSAVTPEMALNVQHEVHILSPELAQFESWGSKEATETYLEQLLLEADEQQEQQLYSPSPDSVDTTGAKRTHQLADHPTAQWPHLQSLDSPDLEQTGTAIIYQQPGQYMGEESSSSPDFDGYEGDYQNDGPTPPPKDRYYSPLPSTVYKPVTDSYGPLTSSRIIDVTQGQLPEIQSAGEGLGLHIDVSPVPDSPTLPGDNLHPAPKHLPPPPPPVPVEVGHHFNMAHQQRQNYAAPSPSVYTQYPPSSIFPASSTLPMEGGLELVSDLDIPPVPPIPQIISTSAASPEPPQGNVLDDAENQKRLIKRRNLIKELLDTESSYCRDMQLIEDIYKATSNSIEQITEDDKKILFGNSDEIVKFSIIFLDSLKQAVSTVYVLPKAARWNAKRASFSTSNSTTTTEQPAPTTGSGTEPPDDHEDRKTSIGAAFIENMERMEKVYWKYVRNHDAANKRLKELQDKPKVKLWLSACQTWAGDMTQAWDLDSLLVKPTQRFLKYSLLVTSTIECTPEDHPDRENLQTTRDMLLELSYRINESKRSSESVQTYNRKRKDSDTRLPTVLKAFGRRTEKLRQQVGLSDSASDGDYDAVAQKFGGHFFQLQIVLRDVEKYIDDVQAYMDHWNQLVLQIEAFIDSGLPSQYPEIESKWRRFAMMVREISSTALPEHKAMLRKSVIDPILTLWKLHENPQRLMQKRKKHVVDYAKYKNAKDKGEKLDKKSQEAGEKWLGLNETLKLELPQLYALTKKLVEACLLNFIQIQATWQSTWQRKLESAIEQPQDHGRPTLIDQEMMDVIQEFNSDFEHIKRMVLELSTCGKSLSPDMSGYAISPASTVITDDLSLKQRTSTQASSKRTPSMTSEQSYNLTSANQDLNRLSGSFAYSNYHFDTATPPLDGQPLPSPAAAAAAAAAAGRIRAGSALSSRGPSTPRIYPQAPTPLNFGRPLTGSNRSAEPSPSFPRPSLDYEQPSPSFTPSNPSASGVSLVASNHQLAHNNTHVRSSSIFSSALPMSDSPTGTRAATPEEQGMGDPQVIFLAASLFEFNIAHDRREAGFPYLVYVPGEIFDVIATKGELWLARNQDDSTRTIGWIWEKHFARILPDET